MEENMIQLVDSEGNEFVGELLDVINKDDVDYAVVLPEDSEDEVVIFKTIPSEDNEEEVEYVEVDDDAIADEIFNEFIAKDEEE